MQVNRIVGEEDSSIESQSIQDTDDDIIKRRKDKRVLGEEMQRQSKESQIVIEENDWWEEEGDTNAKLNIDKLISLIDKTQLNWRALKL